MQRNDAIQRPLLPRLIAAAVGLVIVNAVLFLVGRTSLAAVILLVWFEPTIYSFAALAALGSAFLAFGQYQVRREPMHFWIGMALSAYAIFALCFVLSWPGLLPGDRAIIAQNRNTVSWFFHLMFSTVAIFLLAAPLVSWPRAGTLPSRRWPWLVAAVLMVIVSIAGLSFASESSLPPLLAGTDFTLLNRGWNFVLSVVFLTGAWLSAHRYRQTGDTLSCYVALNQLFLVFAMLAGIVAGELYTTWWYWQGILLVGGGFATLFGLLSEYVALYQRERERTLELEAARQEEEEERTRLRVLIDTTPVGIVIHSAPNGHLELFNKAAEAILGRPRISDIFVADQSDFYGLHRPDGEPFPAEELPVSRSLRGESCNGVEILVRPPDSRDLSILVNSTPIRDAEGRITEVVTAFQDITPIRDQERLRDEFISAAAHELKTPVTTIKGYAQLMRMWSPQGRDPREAQVIDVINAQCDRINRRVQEMLEVIRFRTAPLGLHLVDFDLGALAQQVVQRMQSATESHRLLLQQDAPALVRADREHIEEVLVSLLDNAIKYAPEGGEIHVRVWSHDEDALVSVMDQGVGIPRERQPHIFEPFYEAVPPGAPGYVSVVALSLYLSKLVVERHGGRIWFESDEGRGSTFYFSLPLARDEGNADG